MDTTEERVELDAFITPTPGIICGRCGARVIWAEPYQEARRILISVVCPRCQESMTCVVEHGQRSE
jgi:DNA-directed RNA polymerase subunit RPC12/RpoP